MKLLYCKCCNRHISRTQWNPHRTSSKCLENHSKKCKGDFYSRGIRKQLEPVLNKKDCWSKYVSQAILLDFLSKLEKKYKGKEAREIIKELRILIK